MTNAGIGELPDSDAVILWHSLLQNIDLAAVQLDAADIIAVGGQPVIPVPLGVIAQEREVSRVCDRE